MGLMFCVWFDFWDRIETLKVLMELQVKSQASPDVSNCKISKKSNSLHPSKERMVFDEIKYIILLKISHPGVSLIPFIAIEFKINKQINLF